MKRPDLRLLILLIISAILIIPSSIVRENGGSSIWLIPVAIGAFICLRQMSILRVTFVYMLNQDPDDNGTDEVATSQ